MATALSLASGLVLLALGISGGIQREIRKHVARWDQSSVLIMAQPASSGRRREGWSWEERRRIRSALAGRAEVATYAFVPADGVVWVDNVLDVTVMAVDPGYFHVRRVKFADGFAFNGESGADHSPSCVVSADLVKTCRLQGAAMGSTLFVGTAPFQVNGVIDCGEQTCQESLGADVWVPLEFARRRFGLASRTKLLMVRALGGNNIHALAPRFVGALREAKNLQDGEENDFQLTFTDGVGPAVRARFSSTSRAVQAAALVSALVGVGVVLLGLFGALASSRRTLQIHRAVGARRDAVANGLLALVVFLFLLGSLGGAVVAWAGVLGFARWAPEVPIAVTTGRCLVWLGLTLAVILVPGIPLIRRAARASL